MAKTMAGAEKLPVEVSVKFTTKPSPVPGMVPMRVPDWPPAAIWPAMVALPREPKKTSGPVGATVKMRTTSGAAL